VARILIVDDEPAIRDALERALARQGHDVESRENYEGALARLGEGGLDLLITDIRLGDQSGLELIERVRQRDRYLRIVAITAFGSVDVAVQAMRLGADDFVEKPFRARQLLERLVRVLEPAQLARQVVRLERENEFLRTELGEDQPGGVLVGDSPGMQRLRELIERVAPTTANVLICGETGTGKELVARRIHALSPRAERPFVAFNCAAITESLAESELFGHEKGAFTGADRRRLGRFEMADGGTLFLDEIAELAAPLQAKLLRAVQERCFERVGGSSPIKVDVRLLAATNRDLAAEIQAKRFREDLYYRLDVVRIDVPALRQRTADIALLAEHFLARHEQRGCRRLRLAPAALATLQAHPWPGNVRQLENAIHRATILGRSDVLEAEDLAAELTASPARASERQDLRTVLATVERQLLEHALRESGGNLSAAGRALGIERNLLRYKLRKHGLRE
jgi:two-component system response regulator HydG